jgi:hypothetical protein
MKPDEATGPGLPSGTRRWEEEQRVPHLVKYTKADGQTGDHEVEELHEAIAYVEHLRNDEGAETARIFRIDEVSFEFKPYYRVELGASSPKGMPTVVSSPAPVEVAPTPMWTSPAAPEPAKAADAPATPEVEPAPDEVVDPWADAPPPPSAVDEAEHAGANGRRGLFGR